MQSITNFCPIMILKLQKNKTCGDLITIRLNNKKTTLTYDAKSCFFTKAAGDFV